MTVSVTWSKQAAERWLASAVVLMLMGGCGGQAPTAIAPPLDSVRYESSSEASAPEVPPIGLTPLPSAEEVQQAAPGGRADPFGPLSVVEAEDSTTGLTLTGVLLVGNQKRAMLTTTRGTGVVCVGFDGRCEKDDPVLLPTGWSVLDIDVESGCIRLAQNDDPQDPLCIA